VALTAASLWAQCSLLVTASLCSQAIIESHRQLEQVTADYQVHAAHAAQAAAERTAALQHAVDSLQVHRVTSMKYMLDALFEITWSASVRKKLHCVHRKVPVVASPSTRNTGWHSITSVLQASAPAPGRDLLLY